MSSEVLTISPEFSLSETIQYATLIFQTSSGKEKRRSKWSYPLRMLGCQLRYNSKTDIDTLWTFYKARKGAYDTFWIKFPTEYQSVLEAVGTGDGGTAIYNLDYFPIDTAVVTAYLNDVEEEDVTPSNDVGNEVAKLTFDSNVGNNVVITASYDYYFQVRFVDDRLSRQLMAYQLLHAGLKFQEVRWTTYTPA